MMGPGPADPPALQLPPADCASSDDAPETTEINHPSTVAVTCVSLEGATVHLVVQRQATLRAMQKQLCAAFGNNYPYTAAAVCIGEEAFSDFEDVPFRLASNYETVNVIFTRQISDPSGYVEISSKRANKITLEEECVWEALVAKGETQLELEEWVFSAQRWSKLVAPGRIYSGSLTAQGGCRVDKGCACGLHRVVHVLTRIACTRELILPHCTRNNASYAPPSSNRPSRAATMKRARNGAGSIVMLNVGGKVFHVNTDTLNGIAFFNPLVEGRFPWEIGEDGHVFIDRDGHGRGREAIT